MTDNSKDGAGLLPCPLCRSANVQPGVCYGESGEKEPAARCFDCGCRATAKAWNTRSPPQQGDDKPADGAREAAVNEALSRIKPRRPFDDNLPDGMLESDRDFMDANADAINDLIAALRARAAPAKLGVHTARALDWQEILTDRGDGSSDVTGWEADSGFGPWYSVEQYFGSDSYGWLVDYDAVQIGDFDDPDRAKKCAQDDFAKRVAAALSPDTARGLTDEQRDALQRLAGHDPFKVGISWTDSLLLVQSAAHTAKEVLTALPDTARGREDTPPAMTKGTVYHLTSYGPSEYLGADTYYGETTHHFRTPYGSRYIKPEMLAASLASSAEPRGDIDVEPGSSERIRANIAASLSSADGGCK